MLLFWSIVNLGTLYPNLTNGKLNQLKNTLWLRNTKRSNRENLQFYYLEKENMNIHWFLHFIFNSNFFQHLNRFHSLRLGWFPAQPGNSEQTAAALLNVFFFIHIKSLHWLQYIKIILENILAWFSNFISRS